MRMSSARSASAAVIYTSMQGVTVAMRQFEAKAHATEHRRLRMSDARHRWVPISGWERRAAGGIRAGRRLVLSARDEARDNFGRTAGTYPIVRVAASTLHAHRFGPVGSPAQGNKAGEAVIRTPLRELAAQLDATQFAQVHRSIVVNLRAISHVTRGANETAQIHLKGRDEVLPVSRSYLHRFRQM